MCKRCKTLGFDEVLELIEQLELDVPAIIGPKGPAPRPETFPQSDASLIVPAFDTSEEPPALGAGTLVPRELSWGFKEEWKPGVVFNTRIESASKPTWRDSMEHRRCIIPVTSFFETHRSETMPSLRTGKPVKRPYEFWMPGSDVMLVGGIWRGERFSMVTTSANAFMEPIHPRMPLIVRQEELPIWLGPNYQQLADRSTIALVAEPASL